MPHVKFTNNLRRYFPDLETLHINDHSVQEVIDALDRIYPGLAA